MIHVGQSVRVSPNRGAAGPFAICVMTTLDRDERAAEQVISEVALAAYQYFEMVGKTSPYGRVMPW